MPKLLKILIKKIDILFCQYLGLTSHKIKPNCLRIKSNQLIVISTIPFKRHLVQECWNNFDANNFNYMRNKTGIAAGKKVARGLVISFGDP